MNKTIVDNLINNMIEVIVTEIETSLNHSNLIFKIKTDDMTSRLIAKAIVRYNMDWSSDIIRDQVITTLYESMLVVSKDMNATEINLDNKEFIGKVNNLVELKLRHELIPATRRNRNGEFVGHAEELVSPLAEGEETASKLEQLLNGNIKDLMKNGDEEKMNQFLNWYNKNKNNILTRKQIMFIEGELDYIDRGNATNMRKRIADRVTKAYTAKYGSASPRIAVLMDQQATIENILEAKDFKEALLPYMNETYIIDTILDNVSPAATKAFNTGSTETWVLKEYRIALFKTLDKIMQILDKEGK